MIDSWGHANNQYTCGCWLSKVETHTCILKGSLWTRIQHAQCFADALRVWVHRMLFRVLLSASSDISLVNTNTNKSCIRKENKLYRESELCSQTATMGIVKLKTIPLKTINELLKHQHFIYNRLISNKDYN